MVCILRMRCSGPLNSSLVLRYSPYSRAITDIVRSGQLGQLVNAQHIEPVGHWHFAHAYVRGNWSKEAESSFSLVTKSCQYVLDPIGQRPEHRLTRLSVTSISFVIGFRRTLLFMCRRSVGCSISASQASPRKLVMQHGA